MATKQAGNKHLRLRRSPVAVLACVLLIVIIGAHLSIGERLAKSYRDYTGQLRERVFGDGVRGQQDPVQDPIVPNIPSQDLEAEGEGGHLEQLPGDPLPEANAEIQLAKQWLSELALQDEISLTVPKYERAAFGQRWSDDVEVEFGHNGCDTRNDILRRDLTNIQTRPNTRECVITQGDFLDPYSGVNMTFVRGDGTSDLVQIDHVVALANAWYAGAFAWDEQTRRNFANDPINLQATTKAENQAKKAKTADQWLPSDPAYVCTYVSRQVQVKHVYGLSITPNEQQAMTEVLSRC